LPGSPDFVFREQRIAVFVDGCFWHGCPKHFRVPKSNVRFWKSKIEGNRSRDFRVRSDLRRLGWRVVRIWEHSMRNTPSRSVHKVAKALAQDLPEGKKGSGVLGCRPNTKWDPDRGKKANRPKADYPRFWNRGSGFTRDRVNDVPLTNEQKRKARKD
jgi:DNA mismatch endonuclease (patch repair protein)